MRKWMQKAHAAKLRAAIDTLQAGCPANELAATLAEARRHLEALEDTGQDWSSWRMAYDRLYRELEP